MRALCALAALATAGWAANLAPIRPRAVLVNSSGGVENLTATPASVNIQAAAPEAVAGPVSVTISWRGKSGQPGQNWSLSVQPDANAFVNCPAVPASAVRVTCSASTGVSCGSPFSLSASPQQVAAGAEGPGTKQYAVTLLVSFEDKWRYTAALNPSCTLNFVYSLDFP